MAPDTGPVSPRRRLLEELVGKLVRYFIEIELCRTAIPQERGELIDTGSANDPPSSEPHENQSGVIRSAISIYRQKPFAN